jgi:hypothetical protein
MRIARKLKLALCTGTAVTATGFILFAAGYRLASSTYSVPDSAGALTVALLSHVESNITVLSPFVPQAEIPRVGANIAFSILVWSLVAFVLITLASALKLGQKGRAQPSASPNGGPAMPVDNSGVREGPPSVS